MPRVMRVGHSFQILGIAPRTADIFGRAAALGSDKARERVPQLRRKAPLHLYGVPPIVTEIVGIVQCLETGLAQRPRQRCVASISNGVDIHIGHGNTPAPFAHVELIEVIVSPWHDRLNYLVQRVEFYADRHLDAPHHRRFHRIECDLDTNDIGRAFYVGTFAQTRFLERNRFGSLCTSQAELRQRSLRVLAISSAINSFQMAIT